MLHGSPLTNDTMRPCYNTAMHEADSDAVLQCDHANMSTRIPCDNATTIQCEHSRIRERENGIMPHSSCAVHLLCLAASPSTDRAFGASLLSSEAPQVSTEMSTGILSVDTSVVRLGDCEIVKL